MISLSFGKYKEPKPIQMASASTTIVSRPKTSSSFQFLHKFTKGSLSKKLIISGHHHHRQPFESSKNEKRNQKLGTFGSIVSQLPLELQLLVLKYVLLNNVPITKYAYLTRCEDTFIDLGVISVLSESLIDFTYPLRDFRFYGVSKGIEYNTPEFQRFMSMVKRLDVRFNKAIINGSFYSLSGISEDTLWACDTCSTIEIIFNDHKFQYDLLSIWKTIDRANYLGKIINTRVRLDNDMSDAPIHAIEQSNMLKHIDIIIDEELSFKALCTMKHIAMKASRSVTLILETSNYNDIPQNIIEFVNNLAKANPHLNITIRLQGYCKNLELSCDQQNFQFYKQHLTEFKLRIVANSKDTPALSDLDLSSIKYFPKLSRLSIWVDTEDYLSFKRSIVVKSDSLKYLNLESNDKYNFYSKFFKTRLDCPLLHTVSTDWATR